ncbi:MAG: hypothetical protein AAF598_12385 [Bacteroidota bacterium]
MDSSITHIRPRFHLTIPHKKEELLDRLSHMIDHPPASLRGHLLGNHIILDIAIEDQHYWSPQLNFRVEQDELDPNQSIVAGLIGPRPPVWTLFMFIYFALGTTGFFLSCIGVSRYLLGEWSYWLLVIPITILLMLSAYRVGKYGEHLAKDQIKTLKQFVREAIYYD